MPRFRTLSLIAFAYASAISCAGVQRPAGLPSLQTELRPAGFELVVVNWRGEGKELPGLNPAWQYDQPALSPDGKRLALAARPPSTTFPPAIESQIVIYTLPAGPAVHLDGPGQNTSPSWVGNTGKVSFSRYSERGDTTSSLIVRNADGSGQEQVLLDIVGSITGVAWFNDGQRFILTNRAPRPDQPSALRIYSVTDLANPGILMSNDLLPSRPALNHDESVVAFTAAERIRSSRGSNIPSQQGKVYIMQVNGRRLQTVSENAEFPAWGGASNDSTLFFMTTNTRVISSATVRMPPALSSTPPVSQSLPFEFPTSPFVVLSGDSLFITRRRRLIESPAIVSSEAQGVRADSVTQRSLEVVAASELALVARDKGVDLTRHIVDSRSYYIANDPVFAGLAQHLTSYLLPGRNDAHLKELVRILGAAGIARDRRSCPVNHTSPPCRAGELRSILDFSPAVVSADSARLYVHSFVWPGEGPRGSVTVGRMTKWTFTFERGAVGWTMRRVE